jgi:hypothetical protein
MKLPSVSTVVSASVQTFRRFPFVIAIAVVGTYAAVMLLDGHRETDAGILERTFLVSLLGISFLTGLALFTEQKGRSTSLFVRIAGVVLLAAYAFWLPPGVFSQPFAPIIRFWLFFIASHLFVSFAPYTGRGPDTLEFWQFNKTLFLRALTSGLFAFVLFGGLAIALAAVDNLFDVHIRHERYPQLFACVMGVFMTWFFLSGVPRPDEKSAAPEEYPRGLRIFTQYVLLPLVTVYLAILYVYMGKIIVTWAWPHGWVANLVLGFSITGIFSLLLVYPIRDRADHLWIRVYARWFYLALIPLVGLLLIAIWRRVMEYGVTENRYFVIILGGWLAGMVITTLATKGRLLRVIPVSLCALALFSAFGPWGAFSVSERNQRDRLEELVARNGLHPGAGGTVNPGAVPFEDAKDAGSIIRYLLNVHGIDALQPLFKNDLRAAVTDSTDVPGHVDFHRKDVKIAELLGVPYVNEWQVQGSALSFVAAVGQPLEVEGYALLYKAHAVTALDSLRRMGKDSVFSYLTDEGSILVVGRIPEKAVRFRLGPVVDELMRNFSAGGKSYGVPVGKMTLIGEGEGIRVKVIMLDMQLVKKEGGTRVQSLTADLLLAFSSP